MRLPGADAPRRAKAAFPVRPDREPHPAAPGLISGKPYYRKQRKAARAGRRTAIQAVSSTGTKSKSKPKARGPATANASGAR